MRCVSTSANCSAHGSVTTRNGDGGTAGSRRRLAGIPGLSAKPLVALDALIEEIEASVVTTHGIARLAGLPRLRAARA
jgi:hypothetical protein